MCSIAALGCAVPFTAEGGCATWDHRLIHQAILDGALARISLYGGADASVCQKKPASPAQNACKEIIASLY